MRLFIISGLSGAGKTHVMNYLEDVGYFCIDNFPPYLLQSLVDAFETNNDLDRLAVAIDIRGGKFLGEFNEAIRALDEKEINYEVIFMEAANRSIVTHYKLTRRRHPLIEDTEGDIVAAIKKERELLSDVRENADRIIDTTNISTAQCRRIIDFMIRETEIPEFLITLYSFGFKYGLPMDADLVIDVRFLPNPYYIEDMRPLTGEEQEVEDYVLSFEETQVFLKKYIDLLEFLIPKYKVEGKRQLVIAVGCTGGQHRSVAISRALNRQLEGEGIKKFLYHRELWRYGKGDQENVF
ncbi:hypothetical protein AZF37_08310 [endosymbiont 'TC1' of Trimyema compressum]|uniref:RNase adapter RapZ n=1 Tax=endosymbiont 'TC1' of Trimyema compressum TaxID=243899 RepID=UPI0007F1074D|nr:RNase adapter RapZ [endosymbiont 'TC1' of Trimyema compressum]AMP21158.1 hypothetical protein AZF37_08310 [endosymbiont 'TC1' of Trimyema compressum]